MGWMQIAVFGHLLLFGWWSHSSNLTCSHPTKIWRCQGIWACSIPNKRLSIFPWYHNYTLKSWKKAKTSWHCVPELDLSMHCTIQSVPCIIDLFKVKIIFIIMVPWQHCRGTKAVRSLYIIECNLSSGIKSYPSFV